METRESVNTERVGTLAADSHQFDMIGELTIGWAGYCIFVGICNLEV